MKAPSDNFGEKSARLHQFGEWVALTTPSMGLTVYLPAKLAGSLGHALVDFSRANGESLPTRDLTGAERPPEPQVDPEELEAAINYARAVLDESTSGEHLDTGDAVEALEKVVALVKPAPYFACPCCGDGKLYMMRKESIQFDMDGVAVDEEGHSYLWCQLCASSSDNDPKFDRPRVLATLNRVRDAQDAP